MSGEKTEKPTPKKLKDSAEEGQSYKSRDMVAACILAAGVFYLGTMSFSGINDVFRDFVTRGENISPDYAASRILSLLFQLALPFVGVCIVATIVPSLMQSKFILATKVFKLKFDALNPVSGFKKIFNMKTIKELVKALLYLILFSTVIYLFYTQYRNIILALPNSQASSIAAIWLKLGSQLLLQCLASFLIIILIDGLADYYFYIKELKMEKHEVTREYKEQETSSEVKSRRHEIQQELLSGQEMNDIEQSDFILANPTHIAIGVYLNPKIVNIPFVSIVKTNAEALATIAYAKKHGVPIIRDIPLARRLYKTAKPYSFIPYAMLEPIYRILIWLREVEDAHLQDSLSDVSNQENTAAEQVNAKEAAIQAPPDKPEIDVSSKIRPTKIDLNDQPSPS